MTYLDGPVVVDMNTGSFDSFGLRLTSLRMADS